VSASALAAVNNYQADTWRLRRGTIKNCDTGVDIRSLNAGYQGIIEQVNIIGHRYGVRLISTANNELRSCPFGGHTTYTIADIWEGSDGAGHGGGGAPTLIQDCQTEGNSNGTTWFLLVDSSCVADLTQPYTLINNRITQCGILINQTRILNLYSNEFYGCNVVVGGGNPVIFDHGNTFAGVGMRNVTDLVTTSRQRHDYQCHGVIRGGRRGQARRRPHERHAAALRQQVFHSAR